MANHDKEGFPFRDAARWPDRFPTLFLDGDLPRP